MISCRGPEPLLLLVAVNAGSLHQKLAFAFVSRHGRCSFEVSTSLFEATEFLKKVAADARRKMVAAKQRNIMQAIN